MPAESPRQVTRSSVLTPAVWCAALLLALHGGRAALSEPAQLEIVRACAFVPARLLALIAPDWIVGRLAAAPPDAARLAAFWLGDGAAAWSVFTYALIHAGWAHALSNAALLAALGAPAARRLTAGGFAALLGAGAGAGAAAQMLAFDAAFAPLVGASACVCAVFGAAARLWTAPGERFGPPATEERDRLVAALRRPQARAALAAGVAALLVAGLAGEALGWRAHLGGFVAGFVLAPALPGRRKTERAQACRSPRTDASFESDKALRTTQRRGPQEGDRQ